MLGQVQDKEARRALKRVLRKGGEAAEEDCHPLFVSLVRGAGGLTSDGAAAPPVVLALARDRPRAPGSRWSNWWPARRGRRPNPDRRTRGGTRRDGPSGPG
ncbi:hypothetical protein GTY54_19855 [Streptomyces sp. SID625]|nr:hypothetical protein [Streptomyces sp. SID625]